MAKSDLNPFYEVEKASLPTKPTPVATFNKIRIGGGNDFFSIKGGGDILIKRNIDMDGHTIYNIVLDSTVSIDPSSLRGNLIRLSSQSASSSASIDFTGIDGTYDEYVILINNLKVSADGAFLKLRVSTDGGSTYKAGASDYTYGQAIPFGGGGTYAGDTTADGIEIGGNLGNAASESYNGEIHIFAPSSATIFKRINIISSWIAADSNIVGIYGTGMYQIDTNAINALRIITDTGTISSGTITLYGRNGG